MNLEALDILEQVESFLESTQAVAFAIASSNAGAASDLMRKVAPVPINGLYT